MTAPVHGTGYPMEYIPDQGVAGGHAARADVLRIQAGRARHLYEMLSGQQVAGSMACAPIPPHAPPGVPGHSHAGGVDGVPMVRPIFSAVFGGDDTVLGTDISGGRAPRMNLDSTDASTSIRYIYNGTLKGAWVPGCPPAESDGTGGCYYDAEAIIRLYSSATATVYLSWSSGGYQLPELSQSTGGAGYYTWTVPTRILLYPGCINQLGMKLWIKGTWDGATGPIVSLLSVSVNQTKTTA